MTNWNESHDVFATKTAESEQTTISCQSRGFLWLCQGIFDCRQEQR
jgi:hypothetical protein